MLATRMVRGVRFVAPAVAAAAVVAAGGWATGPARASEDPPCDDSALGTVVPGQAPIPCPETPPPTVTDPVEEPAVTTPADPAPPPAVAAVPPPAPRGPAAPPPTTTATAADPPSAPPAATTPTSSGGGIFGSGTVVARPPSSKTPPLSGGPYVFPVVGPASFIDTWGAERATVAWHHGVDIFASLGAPLVAVADGTLSLVGWNRIGGRRLWLRDREGNYFYYAHLSAFSRAAVEGARVRAGTVIGYVGNTGDALGTPYHLHFEIHPVSMLSLGYDGAVNPFPYVSSWQRLDADALEGVSTVEGLQWAIVDDGGAASFSGAVAATAPAPGAMLLGSSDISSVHALSPQSVEEALDEQPAIEQPAVTAPARVQEQPTESAPTQPALPPSRGDDSIARSLDADATRPRRHADNVWDAVAVCESGSDWGANTGNGYVGGLQFLPATWDSHGGREFAASAHLATREQQITIAERVLASQGWRAWPACSLMLGLRSVTDD